MVIIVTILPNHGIWDMNDHRIMIVMRRSWKMGSNYIMGFE
jgi:hypothetical protein